MLTEQNESNLVPLDGDDDVTVSSPLEERAATIHQRLLEIEVSIRSSQFDVAELLHEIRRDELYKKIGPGYQTFFEYVNDEFGMGDRRAQYLVKLWEYFGVRWRECPDMLAEARRVGWTSSKELIGVVTPENFGTWFKLADEGGVRKLKLAKRAAIKDAQQLPANPSKEAAAEQKPMFGASEPPKPPPPSPEKKPKMETLHERLASPLEVPDDDRMKKELKKNDEWVTRSYRFHKDMLESVDAAVDVARRQSDGRAKDSAFCLDMICVAFLASAAAADVSLQRDDLLRGVQRITGVTLIAVDEDAGEIVFGQDAAERLSGK